MIFSLATNSGPFGASGFETLVGVAIAYALALALVMLAGRNERLRPPLEGFVLATGGAILLFYVFPRAISSAGLWAILVGVGGLLTPNLLERRSRFTATRIHNSILIVAVAGLALHALAAGPGLATLETVPRWSAVILHQFALAVVILTLFPGAVGVGGAVAILGLVAGCTLGGALLGVGSSALLTTPLYSLIEVFAAGSLLHVLVHRPLDLRSPERRVTEVLGGLAGLALVVAVLQLNHWSPGPAFDHYGEQFLHLTLESAPALLLGYLLAGIMTVALPRASLEWVGRGSRLMRASRGVALGIPIPICSCGVVPVYRSLVNRGVPAPAALAFLVATPELGIESLLLSVPLLGGELTIARLVAAVLVALGAGVLVSRFVRPGNNSATGQLEPAPEGGFYARVRSVFRFGLGETVDDTAAWILVGLAVAAALEPASLSRFLTWLPAGTDVLLFAVVGMPIYVCASGATPLGAALIFAGASPGAAIAFLLSGPATNITTFGVLSKLHSRRVALVFGVVVVTLSVALGYAINLLLPTSGFVSAGLGQRHDGSWLQWGSLAVLGAVFLFSLLRKGLRGTVAEVIQVGGHDDHDHADHDHAGHDHSGSEPPEGGGALSINEAGCGSCCQHGAAERS